VGSNGQVEKLPFQKIGHITDSGSEGKGKREKKLRKKMGKSFCGKKYIQGGKGN